MLIKENVHMTFDETNQILQEAPKLDIGDQEITEFQRLKITAEQNNE